METKLQRIIKERGLKQSFIAEKAEITPGTLSKIVRGESIPTLIVGIKIARVVNETVEDLWGDLVK
ncbi:MULTISPECIES: helix-turn-helix transcriptional regulator [Cytobacillus]|uniref:Transcriptional regulator n=1 Tax=Cytobacillus oceanisediminis TaxID=665099 RepID=A0ABX3CNN0_9BACI|nr:helix-turn-helix domain-containing protein [Cytobacillus oceanisediminis]OHX45082.1 transcriptional regulator [Cytobacillus oceanisediminis]